MFLIHCILGVVIVTSSNSPISFMISMARNFHSFLGTSPKAQVSQWLMCVILGGSFLGIVEGFISSHAAFGCCAN